MSPREVRVALREADLAEAIHHRGPRERFGQEDCVGMTRANVGNEPLPERQRFGMRIVDAENQNAFADPEFDRSEEHTSELQSLMRTSYAVFCLKKKKKEDISIAQCTKIIYLNSTRPQSPTLLAISH